MRFAAIVLLALLAPPLAAAEEVRLAWRLEKGAVLRYRHSTEQETTTRLGEAGSGDPQKTTQKQRVEYRLSVLDIDPATGAARVLCRYEQVAVELEMVALGRMVWDSRKREDQARADEPLVRPFARLVGQEVSFLLAPDGAVRELRGADKLRAAVLSGLEDSAFAKANFAAAFGDATLQAELERGFAVLPPGPVGKGATWMRSYEQPVPLLGALACTLTAKLDEVAEGRAVISFKTTMTAAAAATATAIAEDPALAKVAVELRPPAEGEGKAVFSIAAGRLERSESRTRLKLATRLEPPVAPKSGPGAAAALCEVEQMVVVERIAE